jgi:hypothetical protein
MLDATRCNRNKAAANLARLMTPPLKQPRPSHTGVAVLADNELVVRGYAERLAVIDDLPRHPNIC